MKRINCSRFNLSVFLKPFSVGLFALILFLTVGCRQNGAINKAETSGGETEGSTGTGKMIDKEDQKKLPINPKDYEPMPIPNPEEQPLAKDGPDAEKPSVEAMDKNGKSKDDE